jgi:hypothetical protein
MFRLFGQKKDETPKAKILVASLSDVFAAEMEADSNAYRSHYNYVDARLFLDPISLKDAIGGVDLLHLFGRLDSRGQLNTASGEQFATAALLDDCVSSDVKTVILASENEADDYVRGVPARPLNLVMTLHRNGKAFPEFLYRLCTLLSNGVTLPSAWARSAPQASGPSPDSLPECIFHAAGRRQSFYRELFRLPQSGTVKRLSKVVTDFHRDCRCEALGLASPFLIAVTGSVASSRLAWRE